MNDLTININKEYKCDAKTLFQAIGEGVLFKYTGALMDKLKMDFKEGGDLAIDWGDSTMTGKFTSIKPYHLIAFTWNFHSPELNKDVSTLVTINIKEEAGKSMLTLVHEGIATEKQKADMTWGWTDAVEDMDKSYLSKMAGLSLTVKKEYSVSTQSLFETLKKGALFVATGALPDSLSFDFRVGGKYHVNWIKSQHATGEFTEIIPNEKIVFTWTGVSSVGTFNNTIVTVTLKPIPEQRSELTLQHTGFESETVRKDHETDWNESLQDLKM
jgi:uncharacterized protein YndB with AHSA1/START domain